MENKENNAVEKVENISENKNKNTAKATRNGAGKAKKSVSDNKTARAQKQGAKRAETRQEKRRKREAAKAERERIRAQKRVDMARIKAHKKAEKQKAKATALRERNRRIAEQKERREQLRAEKEKRRDMIKKETKKQREARIAEERNKKAEAKRQRREQKLQAKKEAKERRSKNRQRRKERNRGVGGWLAAVISLGVATLVLASVLTFTFLMPTESDNMLEANYRKSFYDTVEQVDNMDLNLSKALATSDTGAMQLYLTDLAINSELAENDIQQLPLHDESKYYTTKVINQIGDYAKYLNKKLINGERVSSEERSALGRLYKANLAIKNSLMTVLKNMGNDYSFSSLNDGGSDSLIISNFNELQNLSVEYPELIYDGPFSDARDRREAKGLDGDTVNAAGARDIFARVFGVYGINDTTDQGTTEGVIKCYNVSAEVNGDILYAQISERGGKMIMFAYAGSCREVNLDGDLATEKAMEFLSGLGINGMRPVWQNLSNNVYTINFAATEGNIIIYSDLIKVRVCAETGIVIGMEAMNYYMNHIARKIDKPVFTAFEAQKKVSENIEVFSSRLAVIPIGEKTEKLCYEFCGEYDGSVYYVYIDAVTGRQVEMFKVVRSTEGELLM